MKKFILELLARFFSKNPKFFRILQILACICAFITGIPALLHQYNIVLSPSLSIFENKTVAICAMVVAFFAQLPNEDQSVKQ